MYGIKVELVNDTNMFKMRRKSADGHTSSNELFAKVVKSSNSVLRNVNGPKRTFLNKLTGLQTTNICLGQY